MFGCVTRAVCGNCGKLVKRAVGGLKRTPRNFGGCQVPRGGAAWCGGQRGGALVSWLRHAVVAIDVRNEVTYVSAPLLRHAWIEVCCSLSPTSAACERPLQCECDWVCWVLTLWVGRALVQAGVGGIVIAVLRVLCASER